MAGETTNRRTTRAGLTRRRLLGGLLAAGASALALGATACLPQPGPRPGVSGEGLARPDQPAAPAPTTAPAPPAETPTPVVAPTAPPRAEPTATAAAELRAFEALVWHLGVPREELEAVEGRYFAGLGDLLIGHGALGPNERIGRGSYAEPLRRFQRASALPETGLPDDATLWALASGPATTRRLELVRVEADKVPGRDGFDGFDLREDVADRYRKLRAAAKELGAVVTSASSFRELDAPTTAGRVPASLHHLGLAFDLAPSSGMQSRESDPYVVTQEVAGWRVWARAERGTEKVLPAVFWRDGKPFVQEIKARVVDFTALAQQHGFRGIGAASGFPELYETAEWWHFQCEEVLTPFLSQFGVELLRLSRYSEAALRAAGSVWERRADRFVFDRDRGSWRFAAAGPRTTAEAAARYYRVVADQIGRTLADYSEIHLSVPARDPLAQPAGRSEPNATELVVHTPYWINDGEDADKRAENVSRAHPDLQSAFKAAPFNGRVAKGTPDEIRATVEGALRTGRIRAADGSWPPARADVAAWMNDFGVGVDCSGFVYETLTRVEKALTAQSLGRLAVARLGSATQVNSKHARDGHPIVRPRDLSVGDLMFRPPQPDNPISHVRIVESVEATDEGLVFTTAESTFDGAGGPRSMRWRFPDPSALTGLQWYVDGSWQPAQAREYTDGFWRHLPLMRAGLTTLA